MIISEKIVQSIRKDLEYVNKKLKKALKIVYKEHKLSIEVYLFIYNRKDQL